MIYAIILIVVGFMALIFNKGEVNEKISLSKIITGPLFIVWGVVGVLILSTIRFSTFYENESYWILLIVGSFVEILIGGLFIKRYIQEKKVKTPSRKSILTQGILGVMAVLVGVATILAKY